MEGIRNQGSQAYVSWVYEPKHSYLSPWNGLTIESVYEKQHPIFQHVALEFTTKGRTNEWPCIFCLLWPTICFVCFCLFVSFIRDPQGTFFQAGDRAQQKPSRWGIWPAPARFELTIFGLKHDYVDHFITVTFALRIFRKIQRIVDDGANTVNLVVVIILSNKISKPSSSGKHEQSKKVMRCQHYFDLPMYLNC